MIKRYTLAFMSMAILIGVISISPVSAQTSFTTYNIDFEGLAEGEIISAVSCGAGIDCPPGSPNVTVSVDGRNSIPANAGLNTAMIFDAECYPPGQTTGGNADSCTGEDDDLFFPGHGNTMINSEDRDSSDPDDADVIGTFLEFDFFGLAGTVTVASIDVGDVEEIESRDAFINFHGGNCSELDEVETKFDIPTIGDNQIETIQIGVVGGVRDAHCVQVRLNGSGTIDNIRFTVNDTPQRGIRIEKATNGQDADSATDPNVPQIQLGQAVTWTYNVTNTGSVPLATVTVTDDNGTPADTGDDFVPTFTSGDTNNNGLLDLTETWIFTATATALDLANAPASVQTMPGCGTPTRPAYQNKAVATGNTAGTTVTDDDLSHYCNPPGQPGILIEKATNGQDADSANDAPQIAENGSITWTYVVTNTGTVPLATVVVTDDQGLTLTFQGGDSNNNQILETTETWTYTASGTAENLDTTSDVTIVLGCGSNPPRNTYKNVGTVTAVTNDTAATPVNDADPSHYCNPPVAGTIDIEKWTKIAVAPSSGDVCQTLGKPKTFTLRYTGDNVLNHHQKESSVKGKGTLDGESPVHITSKKHFDGNVNLGESFDTEKGEVIIRDLNGQVLKEIAFHTSCSQPLVLGDQYGGVMLVGYTSKEGKSATFDPAPDSGFGEDADEPAGPSGQVGDPVIWTYFVKNTGTVPLDNVVVRDDNGTPADTSDDFNPAFVSGDTNGDDLLDLTETWNYQARGTVKLGQYKNIGSVSGVDPTGTTVRDQDPSHHNGVLPAGDTCDDGKPATLTMRYTGGNTQDHSQASGKVNVTGDLGAPSPVHIIAAKNSDGGGSKFFEGDVSLGDSFVIDGSQSKLGSSTFVLIFAPNGGGLLQKVLFHTSCSQPLEPGDQYGGIQLVSFTVR